MKRLTPCLMSLLTLLFVSPNASQVPMNADDLAEARPSSVGLDPVTPW